eukprot:TRINITY_DN47639_c0_g1_i1.p1 TRINITY_DN47639_c0_g1~~TRINITY_DN47639_c0_g1_i1.p1  ORF type:complete len:269 (+),score=87.60 TRINITY_DN47639_c0_g1_i1:92-808(+)
MPGRHDFTPAPNVNFFEGEFQRSFETTHSKVVEVARDKESGTASRSRGKRGVSLGQRPEATITFHQVPPEEQSPRRQYEFKAPGRNVIRAGEMEPEHGRPGKKFTPLADPKPEPRTHKRVLGSTNTSGGVHEALRHTAEECGSPRGGKKTDLPSPRHSMQRPWLPREGAPSPTHAQKKKGKLPTHQTTPWDHGLSDSAPQKVGRRPHSGRHIRHSFEPVEKPVKHPGYKPAAPFGTDH